MSDRTPEPTPPPERLASRPWRRAAWVLFAVFLLLGLANTGEAWLHSHHGWAGSRRGTEARNYLRYGFLHTGLQPLDNVGRVDGPDGLPRDPLVYWHHPPAVMMYQAAIWGIFGVGEAQARLGFLFLSALTFWLLYGVVRRRAGERAAVLVLGLYTFMPVQATYLNWVNFEVVVLLSMAALFYAAERHRETRQRRWLALGGAAVVLGVFGDYPALPFLFYFYLFLLVLLWHDRARRPAGFWPRYGLGLAFPAVVLAATGLLLWLMLSWQDSLDAFVRLAEGRSKMGVDPFSRLAAQWDWYVDFFTPAAYLCALVLYPLDLVLRRFRLRALDGVILVYLASALTFLIPLKQWLVPHEFGVLYMVPVLALAGGLGLERLCTLLAPRRWAVALALGLVAVLLVGYSLPIIHTKHCSPMFEFPRPEYGQRGRTRFEFQLDHRPLGELVQARSAPDETILLRGLPWKPWSKFYLDRDYERVKDAYQLHGVLRKGQFQTLVLDLHRAPYGFLVPLLAERPHLRFGRHTVVDLAAREGARTEVWALRPTDRCFFGRYFTSHVHTDLTPRLDPWRSLDYARKLGREADADHFQGLVGDVAADPLIEAVTGFNAQRARGTAGDLAPVRAQLAAPAGRSRLPGGFELVGYRARREVDGRQRIAVVLRRDAVTAHRFQLGWWARSRAADESLRKRLGTYRGEAVFDVPTPLWRPGWLYLAEFDVDAPLEEYAVSVGLTYVDAELLRDARTHSSRHAISCRPSPADPEAEAQAPDEVQGRALGRRFQLLDCVAHPVAGDPELVDLTLQLRATEPAPPSFEWKIQGPGGKGWTRTFVFPPKGDALSEVETREVTVRVPASPDPTRGRLTLTASVPPLRPGGVRAALFEKGEAGIRFPGHWLVRADAWRWWLKDW